jgi:hypothetical protein
MKALFLAIILHLFLFARAQYTERFQEEFFFGHLNNAATEAMGRADAAIGGKAFSMCYNPAGTGVLEHREVALSTSGPYYILGESDFYYVGLAEKVNQKLSVAASFNQLAIGPTTFMTDIGSDRRLPLDEPTSTKSTINLSYEVLSDLYIGTNVNQFRLKFFDDVDPFTSYYFDGGALYRHRLDDEKKKYIQVGASLMNINHAMVTLESPSGQTSESGLPSILRTGVAYHQKTPLTIKGAKPGTLELTCTAEIEAVRSFDYRTMKKVGVEVVFYELLNFRCGYLSWNQNDMGFPNNLSTISNFTYGFGTKIPSSKWNGGNFPFDILLDFTSLAQPPYTNSGRRIANMRSFSTRLVWSAKKGGGNE